MQRFLGTVLAVAALVLGLTPLSVSAQTGLTITTPYPSVTVDPGGKATFDLTITTPAPELVNLSVTTSPGDTWTTKLRGGGSIIGAVLTSTTSAEGSPTPEATATATLEVNVPVDVQPGEYNVVLTGLSGTGSGALVVVLTVEQLGVGSVTLTTQNPVQQNKAGSTFTFNVQLKNDTNEETTFTLDAQGPADWDVNAVPAGSATAASFVVAAGSSSTVTVSAISPDDAAAGDYPITLSALGGPQPATLDLGARVTGSFGLSLDTTDGRLNAQVQIGADSTLNLEVENTGTSDLEGVSLTATPPTGWTVTFAPESIDVLPAREKQAVVATIHASDKAVTGDYELTIRASSSTQGSSASDSVEIRTTVNTSPLWGFVGVALIALVVVGLFFVFRLYGRR